MPDTDADTVAYYDRHAREFAAQTVRLDLSPLHRRFLRHLRPRGRILDAGCGVGRDAIAFAELGYQVVGFDASEEMVRLARERVGCQIAVHLMRFEDLVWRDEFDAIWACASLLHVPAAAFSAVASRLVAALRPGGFCYMSFKLGGGERVVGGRLFVDHTEETLCAALAWLPVEVVETWRTSDVRPSRETEGWLNAVLRRCP